MPLQAIRFHVAGDVQYSRAFEAAATEASDLSEPLAAVGEDLIHDIQEQFVTEGAFGGGSKWQPLSPVYERWKQQQVGEEPIMVFHGTLRARMIAHSAIHISPRRLVYDPEAPDYGIVHQRGEGDMPQRKLVDIPETARRGWDRIFVTWLNEQRRSGWGTAVLRP